MRWCITNLSIIIRYFILAIISATSILIPEIFLDTVWVLPISLGVTALAAVFLTRPVEDIAPPMPNIDDITDPKEKLAVLETYINNNMEQFLSLNHAYTQGETLDDAVDNFFNEPILPTTHNFKDEKDIEEIKRSDVIEFE